MIGSPKNRERDSVFLLAHVSGAGAVAERYRVRNLSREGACIEQAAGLERGANLMVSIGLVEAVQAEVMWSRGGFAGLRFAAPIDPARARKRPPRSIDPQAGWEWGSRI